MADMEADNMSVVTSIEEEAIIEYPKWLEPLLQKTFFGTCTSHLENSKNELNRYCITCDKEACRYCMISGIHDDHNLLQIYRHVYQDVVTLSEIENHVDCSKVQPYRCNKKWIVALNPLAHCGSGAQIDEELSCDFCKRKLMDPDQYRYCCIACKWAEAFRKKQNEGEVDDGGVQREERRRRRRKGIPTRAAF